MKTEVRIAFGWNGLAEIDITVPLGYRGAGLDVLDAALPALRDLTRRLQHPVERAVPDDDPFPLPDERLDDDHVAASGK